MTEFVGGERFWELCNQLGSMLGELKAEYERELERYHAIKREKGSGREVDEAFEDLETVGRLFMHVKEAHGCFFELEMTPQFRMIDCELEEEQS